MSTLNKLNRSFKLVDTAVYKCTYILRNPFYCALMLTRQFYLKIRTSFKVNNVLTDLLVITVSVRVNK